MSPKREHSREGNDVDKDELIRQLQQQVLDLDSELEETYRSITELTNEVEGEREKFRRLEFGLRQEYCFYTLDLQQQLLYLSPSSQTILGYSSKEEMNFSQIHTSHPINDKRERVWASLLKGESQPVMEWEIYNGEGEVRRVERSDFAVFNSHGAIICVEGVLRDITERKRREAELLQAKNDAESAHRTKSNFLSHMSHELRTPLNGVLGYVQLLLRDKNFTVEQVDYLTAIESCGHHLLSLINRVLDFSKVENFDLEIQGRPCRLPELLQDIQYMVSQRAAQKQISLVWEYSKQLPELVFLDSTKLKQVLLNLLSNAIKFTGKGGEVVLRIEPDEGERWRFSVQDNGVGINEEQLAHIFSAFHQTRTGKQAGGVGLGLAICSRIVDAMGGTLEVKSEMLKGSRFWFSLPLITTTQSAMLSEEDISPPGLMSGTFRRLRREKKLQALVVDDQVTNQNVLKSMLEQVGIQVLLADSGRKAIELWKEHDTPLVFLDLRMPGMDGFETAQAIRRDKEFSQPWIIAVSAAVSTDEQAKSYHSGCQGFLQKPLRWSEVMDIIENLYPDALIDVDDEELPPPQEEIAVQAIPIEEQRQMVQAMQEALVIGNFPELRKLFESSEVMLSFPQHKRKLLKAVKDYDNQQVEQLLAELYATIVSKP